MYKQRPAIAITFDSSELTEFVHWKLMFQGIVEAGAVPLAVDCGQRNPNIEQIVAHVDGLVISGGVDIDPALYGGDTSDVLVEKVNPARDRNEISAFESARQRQLPILAICRGAQLVNVVLGGSIYADLQRDWAGRTGHMLSEEALERSLHEVTITPGTLLAQWSGVDGAVAVNSQHHQGIKTLAPGATPAACTDDGLIEAFEVAEENIVAVQWHPEVLWNNEAHALELLRRFAVSSAPPPHAASLP